MNKIFQSHFLVPTILTLFLAAANVAAQDNPPVEAPEIPPDPTPRYLSIFAGGEADQGNGGPALLAYMASATTEIDLDDQGSLYFYDGIFGELRRIDTDGIVSSFNDLPSGPLYQGITDFVITDGYLYAATYFEPFVHRISIATGVEEFYAQLDIPEDQCCSQNQQVVINSSGDVYFSTQNRVFKYDKAAGTTTHFAGTGGSEGSGDNIPATSASINAVSMVIDPRDDSLLILDNVNNRVSRINPDSGILSFVSDEWPIVNNVAWALDLMPNGDIIFSINTQVYRVSAASGEITVIAGNGNFEYSGDGGPALAAGMIPAHLAVDPDGNFYVSYFGSPGRIRYIDTNRDIVSTIIGNPGRLACASPLDSILTSTYGIQNGPDDIIYLQSNGAIFAIDQKLNIIYSVAGVWGITGDTDDGLPAFGNPIRLADTTQNFAVAPNGDIYVSEQDRIRRINHETGLFETVKSGSFKDVRYPGGGSLYAIRNRHTQVDFVEIDIESGQLTVIANGGEQLPVIGESVEGRKFFEFGLRFLTGFDADSEGNIYLALGRNLAPGLASGIYRIDRQTRILSAVAIEEPDSSRFVAGQLVLDEERNVLYYGRLTYNVASSPFDFTAPISILKVDLTTGAHTRFAGSRGYYDYDEDPLKSSFVADALSVAENGDLYFVGTLGVVEVVGKISPERTVGEGLVPDDIADNSQVGASVARYENWLAIGVPNSKGSAGGSGEVLVYQDNDCRPILQERLTIPEGYSASEFGSILTFAGDSLVIGAAGPATPVVQSKAGAGLAPQAEPLANGAPLPVSVFGLKNGRSWSFDTSLAEKLPPSESAIQLVAEGKTFAVGLPDANSGQGEVVVFNTGDLDNPVSIKPPRDTTSKFGKSLAISGSKVAVGSDTPGSVSKVDLWQKSGSQYLSTTVLDGPAATSEFATALVLNEDSLYVGAPDAAGGKVFDYTVGAQGVDLTDTLVDSKNPTNSSFGTALALEGGILVVGAPDSVSTEGQSISPSPESGRTSTREAVPVSSGIVQLFGVKDGSGRKSSARVLATLAAISAEEYGKTVDINNGRVLVGAPKTDNGKGLFESAGEMVNPAELSGLWYDPSKDGEGYNLLVAGNGLVVFYYGYDNQGERLWLISETVTDEIRFGEDIQVALFKSVEGEFAAPSPSSEALVKYGILSMSFGSLRSATFTVNGFDGNKISKSVFLADTTANSAAYSGLWFDPAQDGEGYNVISGKFTTVIYYYGSTSEGERLWLISDGMSNDISDGQTLNGKMYEAVGGDFNHPEPSSSSLRDWGTIEARFDGCDGGRFILNGNDGNKTSQVIKLAGVDGAACN